MRRAGLQHRRSTDYEALQPCVRPSVLKSEKFSVWRDPILTLRPTCDSGSLGQGDYQSGGLGCGRKCKCE